MNHKKLLLVVTGLVCASLLMAACGPASPAQSSFPTGKFVLPDVDSEGIYFGDDGTWYAFYYGANVAEGTYHIEDDLYIEEANPETACPTSASYRYSFDGTNLKFDLVGEDSCQNRRESFNGVTYVLSK